MIIVLLFKGIEEVEQMSRARLQGLEINNKETMNNLRDLITISPFNIRQIAESMNVSEETIKGWLKGKSTPNYCELSYLVRGLGYSLDDIIVYNYELDNQTLESQRRYLESEYGDIMEEERDSLRFEANIASTEYEKCIYPAYTINEMMMYFQIMDDKAIRFLRDRLINTFIGKQELSYIRKTFKFVIEKMIHNERKEIVENDINFFTHNPSFLHISRYSRNKFKKEKYKAYKEYREKSQVKLDKIAEKEIQELLSKINR